MWLSEGPFPNPFGLSVFGGLALAVLCFPILDAHPHLVFGYTYLTTGSLDLYFFLFACGRGLALYEASLQVPFTCKVGASGHNCFVSLVRSQRTITLALGEVERGM